MAGKRNALALLAALSAVVAGTTSAHAETGNHGPSPAAPSQHATLIVHNNNPLDANIFVVSDKGTSRLIGTVARLNSSTLAIPTSFVEGAREFRIKVVLLSQALPGSHVRRGVKSVKTNPISPAAGDTIRLLVDSEIERSGLLEN